MPEPGRPLRVLLAIGTASQRDVVRAWLEQAGVVVVAEGATANPPAPADIDVIVEGTAALQAGRPRGGGTGPPRLVLADEGAADPPTRDGATVLPAGATRHAVVGAVMALGAGLTVGVPTAMANETLDDEFQKADEELTPRERDVLGAAALGLTNREIARRLGISDHTVKFHLATVYGKLGVTRRTQAVRRAIRRGLVAI